jgi:MFS family permease
MKMAPKVYRAGTLRYTLGGVTTLFVWLLWGDFCFTIFEEVFKRFLPLYMKELQASNTLIGVMAGSVGGVVNVLFLPGISMASDRHRGRWGRRIPFLLWATPCAVGSLIVVGFASEIGAWFRALAAFLPASFSPSLIALSVVCAFGTAYHFFNMIMVNLYQCLLRDVVPAELMARFLALFRVVSTIGTFVFQWHVFRHLIDHRNIVCVGIGLTYAAGFLLMCWHVKEGAYPPPDEKPRTSFLAEFATYFREILRVPLYRNYLLMYALVTAASTCAGPFVTLFARNTLALSMDEVGKVFAWGSLASALTYVPMGYLCDKIAPMRLAIIALASLALAWAAGFFVAQDRASWLVYWLVVSMLPSVAWNLGFGALTMHLFPSEKFGQLSSGLSVLGYGSSVLGSFLVGRFIDLVQSDYRMIFVWALAWFALALVPMALVYRDWKRCGGPLRYVPPLP